MRTETEREELARIVTGAFYKSGSSLHAMTAVLRLAWFRVADAILAAGYRKVRSIESPQELDSLPFGSVVLDFYEVAWTCSRRRVDGTLSEWLCTEFSELVDSHYVLQHGPVTVLHTPEPTP